MKLEFSGQIFEKHSNITLRENPYGGSRVVRCGQTEKTEDQVHDETNGYFLQFCVHA
jgi:hypothetical protein